jgi:beta-galactosidase
MWPLPLDSEQLGYGATSTTPRKVTPVVPGKITFWRTMFDAADTKRDTFLDMSTWGKGVVWVNGHNLGRFWNIGPQQSLYLPAAWLLKERDGETPRNEIIVLALDDPAEPLVRGLDKPLWASA